MNHAARRDEALVSQTRAGIRNVVAGRDVPSSPRDRGRKLEGSRSPRLLIESMVARSSLLRDQHLGHVVPNAEEGVMAKPGIDLPTQSHESASALTLVDAVKASPGPRHNGAPTLRPQQPGR